MRGMSKHLTYANVAATLAVVFAMSGGAFALSGGSGGAGSGNGGGGGGGSQQTASVPAVHAVIAKKAKKKTTTAVGKPGPRGPAGPAGPAGPQGPAGAAGGKGENGANGNNGAEGHEGKAGTDGTNGKTVLSGSGAPTAGTGEEGDFYIETKNDKIYGPRSASGWGAGTELKGKEGEPWTDGGTLPPGKSEKGTWSLMAATTGETASESISFGIPLPEPIRLSHVHIFQLQTSSVPAGCTVTVTKEYEEEEEEEVEAYELSAEPGDLCIGVQNDTGLQVPGYPKWLPNDVEDGLPGAGKTGVGIQVQAIDTHAFGDGLWAVTAPEPKA